MKKIIAVLLTLMTALLFSACQQKGKTPNPSVSSEPSYENFGEITVSAGESYSSLDGLKIRVVGSDFGNELSTLTVEWNNKTVYGVSYSEIYKIERFKEGDWVEYPPRDELVAGCIRYGLEPLQKMEFTYNLSDNFDCFDDGKYRIVVECEYRKIYDKNGRKCNLWAEFTVNNAKDVEGGYCGNTQTTIYIDEKGYTFMGSKSVALTDLLRKLDYKPQKEHCFCAPDFTVDTEFGTGYEIFLTVGYVECDKGRAMLTQSQAKTIEEIADWAKKSAFQDD